MSKVNLTELPSIQSIEHKPVSFRGNTSSTQYNTFQEDAYFDITNLYSVINDMTLSFQEMSMAHSVDSAYTQMRIGDLPFVIEQLQSEIEGYKYGTHRKVIIYPSKVSNGTDDKADINIQYGQINIPAYAITSKLYIHDESLDLITIPSTLISDITPKSDDINIIDNDFENCIKDYENEYFIRKVYSSSTEPVDIQIEITLPDNIISNRNVNTIYISPYPFSALDILAIEYQAETDWRPIPGFTSHKQYNNGMIKDAENIKLCFNKMQIAKIRIKLRQSKYIVEGDKNVFYLGIKYLGVNYEAVDRKFCTFISDINFNSKKKKTIFNITPRLNNNAILSDITEHKKTLFSFEVYSVNDIGDKRYIKDTMPFTITDERLMVITNMYYDSVNDINPSLYKLEIEYDIEGDGAIISGGSGDTDNDITTDGDCKCILSDMIFNGDSIIIGADENSKPYKLEAATILDGDCDLQNHINKNIVYTYTIKSYGAGARISGDTLVVSSAGIVVITATARIGKATISKEATFIVDKIKKYTLTYLSTTGGALEGKKIQNIELGNDATAIVAKPSMGYHFLQWSDGVLTETRQDTNVTSSGIFTAQFEINQYPVIYLRKDGTEFYREMVKHGFPATPPTAPVVEDYLFTGWDKPLDCITEETRVQAQYRIKTFIVKFLDWDDRVISTQEIVIHKDAVVPSDSVREGYNFMGWSQDTKAVTQDITSKALFDIKTFVITFLNWDGSQLSKQTVNWMSDAKPPTATREGWQFETWDGKYTKVTQDASVTARFQINMYQVKFINWDGSTVKTETVSHGSDATAPVNPNRTGYDFTGWDKAFTNIKQHTTVNAQFKIKVFTVSATSTGDGTYSLSATSVEYGSPVTITYSANVTSNFKSLTMNGTSVTPSSNKYTVSSVTKDINFALLFEIKTFDVKWYSSGSLLKSETVNYGANVSGMHPVTSKDGYDFTGWTTSSSSTEASITSNTTFTASFSIKTFEISPAIVNPGDVTAGKVGSISPSTHQVVNWNTSKTFSFTTNTGFELYELQIDGKPIPYTASSYTFSNIKEDHSILAVYRWKTYTVNFVNWDGTTLKTEIVKYGKAATAPSDPTRPNYSFAGWDIAFNNVKSNLTVKPIFEEDWYFANLDSPNVPITTFDAAYPGYDNEYGILIKGKVTNLKYSTTMTTSDYTIAYVSRGIGTSSSTHFIIGGKNGVVTLTATLNGFTHTLKVNMKAYTVRPCIRGFDSKIVDWTSTINIMEGWTVPSVQMMRSDGEIMPTFTNSSSYSNPKKASEVDFSSIVWDWCCVQPGKFTYEAWFQDGAGNKVGFASATCNVISNSRYKVLDTSRSQIRKITLKKGVARDIVVMCDGPEGIRYSDVQPWSTHITSSSQAVYVDRSGFDTTGKNSNIVGVDMPINRPNGYDSSIIRLKGNNVGKTYLKFYSFSYYPSTDLGYGLATIGAAYLLVEVID